MKVMGGHGGHSTGVDAGRQGQPLGGIEVWMGDLSREVGSETGLERRQRLDHTRLACHVRETGL